MDAAWVKNGEDMSEGQQVSQFHGHLDCDDLQKARRTRRLRDSSWPRVLDFPL